MVERDKRSRSAASSIVKISRSDVTGVLPLFIQPAIRFPQNMVMPGPRRHPERCPPGGGVSQPGDGELRSPNSEFPGARPNCAPDSCQAERETARSAGRFFTAGVVLVEVLVGVGVRVAVRGGAQIGSHGSIPPFRPVRTSSSSSTTEYC